MFFCLEIQPISLPGQITSKLKAVIPSRELSLPDTQIHVSQRSYRMYQALGVGEDPLHMCEPQPDPRAAHPRPQLGDGSSQGKKQKMEPPEESAFILQKATQRRGRATRGAASLLLLGAGRVVPTAQTFSIA